MAVIAYLVFIPVYFDSCAFEIFDRTDESSGHFNTSLDIAVLASSRVTEIYGCVDENSTFDLIAFVDKAISVLLIKVVASLFDGTSASDFCGV
jgi:hypothetical protein